LAKKKKGGGDGRKRGSKERIRLKKGLITGKKEKLQGKKLFEGRREDKPGRREKCREAG